MKHESGRISGDLVVNENLTLNGIVTGNITVHTNITLVLNGMCLGELTLEPESNANSKGTVKGSIHNNGALLKINGVVQGDVTDGGETIVSSGARVEGEIKKVSSSSGQIIAGTVGGAVIANMLLPGIGGAVVGGIIGALLANGSSSKDKKDD
ncbi:polymer-forming cytoskeletal protein [Moritella viscosa]|uniref:Uncharacterized protein n=1 Tax=Moritella viscosa TaxID=80854 RepID=A0ABY1HJ88_9GAMM|nr:polymer-forming cytoskeletal protein [Moritella viscosa]SGZ01868.1 Putative uncharacterized protein [Moritella viscosa]